jgi:hypothetical protein
VVLFLVLEYLQLPLGGASTLEEAKIYEFPVSSNRFSGHWGRFTGAGGKYAYLLPERFRGLHG